MPANRRLVKTVRPIPKSRRVDVTRAEFDRVIDLLNERGTILNDLLKNQEIQFKRIAQMQAALDRATHDLQTLMAVVGASGKPV